MVQKIMQLASALLIPISLLVSIIQWRRNRRSRQYYLKTGRNLAEDEEQQRFTKSDQS